MNPHFKELWWVALFLTNSGCPDAGVSTVNAPPTAEITYPSGGLELAAGITTARAVVEDPDGAAENLQATWLVDGDEVCPAQAPTGDGLCSCDLFLDEGARVITMEVIDHQGAAASDAVSVEVMPYGEPWAELSSPESGGVYYSDVLVGLSGEVGDELDDPDELVVGWESSIDGEVDCEPQPDGSGNVLCSAFFSQGQHSLSLWVENTGQNRGVDTVIFDVGPPNSDPECEIESPADGSTAAQGDEIAFYGLVTDADVSPEALQVSWTSDLDGELRSATPDSSGNVAFYDSGLSTGTHVISLAATDDLGAVCSTFVSLSIEDCPDLWHLDSDGDGYGDPDITTTGCSAPSGYVSPSQATDCDDGDAAIMPGADEFCDGVDNDCDGSVDEDGATDAATWYADTDADGYGDAATTNAACDQPSGYVSDATDCDDAAASTWPGADEYCDGADNDCDGSVDEDDALDAATWYLDDDGDGYGDAGTTTAACDQPSGYAATAADCDDGDAAVSPVTDESCNGTDDDCDGIVDEIDAIDASTWYADADGDGWGDALDVQLACSQPTGFVDVDGDCDDTASAVHPGADEYCDGVDTDCDGSVDEDDASDVSAWFADSDGDGWGDATSIDIACTQPSGFVSDWTDCDDADAAINPGASESCNGGDDDCDGTVDEDDAADATTWSIDADGDGYGSVAITTAACEQPTSFVADASDCDDSDADINPAAIEVCDDTDTDEDCDGLADDADSSVTGTTTWAFDADGDGYGDAGAAGTEACEAVSGLVGDATDCDDSDASIFPGADEYCDEFDNDCDGDVDEEGAVDADAWYHDYDRDGYGDAGAEVYACVQPSGYAGNDEDCDDSSSAISPLASDMVGDGDDTNCDGLDGVDADGDGHAADWSLGDDCDDTDSDVNPSVRYDCSDGTDMDCDGNPDSDLDWSAETGGNHCGEDWTIVESEIAGLHYDVGDVVIPSTDVAAYSDGGYGYLVIHAESIVVNGTLDGVGAGYSSAQGPGAGSAGSYISCGSCYENPTGGSGAGYATSGYAGGGSCGTVPSGGGTYGSSDSFDIQMGSGGGSGTAGPPCGDSGSGGVGGSGGAAVVLQAEVVGISVAASLIVDGEDGEDPSGYGSGGGGGSGGGILLIGDQITVDGSLSAIGGEAGAGGADAGDGRIKIFYETSLDTSSSTISSGSYYDEQVEYDGTPYEF